MRISDWSSDVCSSDLLLGERLQAAGELRDLFHAIFARLAAGALQELEIIDHDHADAALALQPPRTGAQRSDGKRRRIVDIERKLLEIGRRAGKVAELVAADLAHEQAFGAYARLFGQNTGGQLVCPPFQREEGDARARRLAFVDAVLPVANQDRKSTRLNSSH